jgi:hypothetical protein
VARGNVFTTVRCEGALLPADFLQKLVEPKSTVEGLSPADYHLAGTEKPTEAASRAWNHLLGVWASFLAASADLKPGERATTITREKWLLPLFQELGYGRLQTARAFEIEGKAYAISHIWQQTPIHLVGRDVDVDRRTPGVAGAARTSPHGLLQEFLNRSEGHLWGFVSNGLKLRVLHDNRTFTRQAYVEFDLAAMMDGQVFADFVLLWLVCHQSRVEGERADQCWLEKWAGAATKGGTRALDDLRDGVQRGIEALGRGFLKHAANVVLKQKLATGGLDKQEYYRQLLREVYRLIFLFVAEDRDLLLIPTASPAARERYARFYSVARLRALAERRRGTQHDDLRRGLSLVFQKLSSTTGCAELGLPALGSFLWSEKGTPDLDDCAIANADVLDAVRALAFTADRGVRRVVDYRNLGPEELGSVYESLLELHPDLNADAGTFELKSAAGHERKTTGSYYTPTTLIDCLLDSALDPVLDEVAKSPDPETAILKLTVCDPACGSGHFLIAAAHRIANRLASVRTGDNEPSPAAVRNALRDVVAHCVYGVDVNPMAVELCKVNLWLEALTPSRPLAFLDYHIQCGNSLLGTTPSLLRDGIPDTAFDPIEGDDRECCRELKRRNRREHQGFRNLFTSEPWERIGDLANGLANLDAIDDSTLDGVLQKESRYAEIVRSTGYMHGQLWADAWCCAFVWVKTREAPALTEDLFRTMERNPMAVPEAIRQEIQRIASDYRFFHWHLAFPDVFRVPTVSEPLPAGAGWIGGFDVVLGNPPWERIKTQEKEWFAERRPDIANAPNAAARKKLIAALQDEDPSLWTAWHAALRRSEGESAIVRTSGRYPLCGRGDVNTYALFAEMNRSLLHKRGRTGFIVPSGIATDDTTKLFFQEVVRTERLISLFDFENREGLFPAVHRSYKFSLLTLSGGEPRHKPLFAFFCVGTDDLRDPDRRFVLSAEDVALLNPQTHTCPVFRSRRDAELTKQIYRQSTVLAPADGVRGWGASYLLKLVDPTIHREMLLAGHTTDDDSLCPLYEGKQIYQFDHRYATFDGTEDVRPVSQVEKGNPSFLVNTRYRLTAADFARRLRDQPVRYRGFLSVRDITNVTNERTVITAVRPYAPALNSLGNLFCESARDALFLCACLNSFPADYVARQKVGGSHLSPFYLLQLAVVSPQSANQPAMWDGNRTALEWVLTRALELSYTSWDLEPFVNDIGFQGAPFRWDAERRLRLRCELDAAFFHLYEIARPDVDHIMGTFPIMRRNEEAAHGEFRTKRMILEIYDKLSEAIQAGTPYETQLDPPPADPRAAHPPSAPTKPALA